MTSYRSMQRLSRKAFLAECAEHGWYPVSLLERLGDLGRNYDLGCEELSADDHSSIKKALERKRRCITDGKNYLWWSGGRKARDCLRRFSNLYFDRQSFTRTL